MSFSRWSYNHPVYSGWFLSNKSLFQIKWTDCPNGMSQENSLSLTNSWWEPFTSAGKWKCSPSFVIISFEWCQFGLWKMSSHHLSLKCNTCKWIKLCRMVYSSALPLLQAQRYEAASTIYGPHTLSAYIQLFRVLAKAIATVIKNYMFVCLRGGEMKREAKKTFTLSVQFL